VSDGVAIGVEELAVHGPAILCQERFDCVVRSPGVSIYRDELQKAKAAGCTVTSATAMWLEDFSESRVVGVTGTKGKTTTACLTAILLEACGLRTRLGGNMGTPLTALYEEDPSDVYVVEVSSFQAADVAASPGVGILTLLSPDHLDWHGTYDHYVRDKLNLFDHREEIALAVGASSHDAMLHTAGYPRRTPYGAQGRVVIGPSGLAVDGKVLLDNDHLEHLAGAVPALRGEHNLANLCGALTACLLAEGRVPPAESIEPALGKMPVLPSRLETVALLGGVEFVNDALASNPAGTMAALSTFAGRQICLIAGGHDRGVDLGPLVREIKSMSPPPSIVALPDLGERLSRELVVAGASFESAHAPSVGEAVFVATEMVGSDGVVLFSPAAPTPEVEGTYVQRGAAFNEAVAQMKSSAT